MQIQIRSTFQQIRQLPGGIWAVSLSMMLIAVSTTMTFSVSPFFVTEVLGLSVISMGVMEGIAEGLSYFSKLGSGYCADLFKRTKPPLMLGVLLATLSKPLFIFANGAGMVVASKVIERVSNGMMATPRDAYCAEACPTNQRGTSLGLMMSLKTFGCMLGSLCIGCLMWWIDDYRALLWLGFIPCILSVIVLWRYMHDAPVTDTKTSKGQALQWKEFRNLGRGYWSMVAVSSLFMLARFTDGILILRMEEMGAPKPVCGMTIGLFNLVSVMCCLPMGALSDRFSRSRVVYFSFITLLLTHVCFMLQGGLMLALLGVAFWGAQRGTSQLLFSAIIADEVPKSIVGTALGIYYVITGLVSVCASTIAGYLGHQSLHYAFIFGLGASVVALVALCLRNSMIPASAPAATEQPIQPVAPELEAIVR